MKNKINPAVLLQPGVQFLPFYFAGKLFRNVIEPLVLIAEIINDKNIRISFFVQVAQ
jgi:hypothetical protein